ncbi:hypothetical protein A2415_00205 [candidate division WWE3 bacterium RIFOXYC1_FULL_39_7]|uniref:Uncharacterized protein n=1 Tax=candidate division WWE3 bacterium RIFOXYC1_FULL_39_7 TaxID=1802643 RepID=A0A1F4WIF8_UNCKA|nr:MAG: hypothetical protein A2415_00205 [candidate division WWE3 bacterium RIFOXYC1_FULL_39_7]
MNNFTQKRLELLSDIEKMTKAIRDETDWYIASFHERDEVKRKVARTISEEKVKAGTRLARKMYEKYK